VKLERKQGLKSVWAESAAFLSHWGARRAIRKAGFAQQDLGGDTNNYVCSLPNQQISAMARVARRVRDNRIVVRVTYFDQDGEILRHWPHDAATPLLPSSLDRDVAVAPDAAALAAE
jgi:hypothetical protein